MHALSLAEEESPELLADYSTLTGAARIALGPELSAYFVMTTAWLQIYRLQDGC